jgi:hypothetical protein
MIPSLPKATGPGQDGGTAEIAPRYEDITQDGRLQVAALMPGIGAAIWVSLFSKIDALDNLRRQGILPVLRRLIAVVEDRPVSVSVPIRYEGAFRFAREKDGDRLFANMWLEARAPIASTVGPPPPADAPYELVGRVFAEHIITRLFAPPAERKVTNIDAPGVPPICEEAHTFESAEALVDEAGGSLDEAGDVLFTMMHTDSNQHVNSLTYPRIFEERATRKIAQDSRGPAHELLARAIDLRWRKPFFAGERARIAMRLADGAPGWKTTATGAFFGTADKPSCALRMHLR